MVYYYYYYRAVHNFFCKGGQPGGKLSNILQDCLVSGSLGLHAAGVGLGMLKRGVPVLCRAVGINFVMGLVSA